MSEVVTPHTHRVRKPPEFPHRLTVCFAPDQVETLAQAKKIYRATESFMLRLAWDNFCRANQISPLNNNGEQNGR
jgi:hypothetical protein